MHVQPSIAFCFLRLLPTRSIFTLALLMYWNKTLGNDWRIMVRIIQPSTQQQEVSALVPPDRAVENFNYTFADPCLPSSVIPVSDRDGREGRGRMAGHKLAACAMVLEGVLMHN